ncbi:hypothetical protein [Agromyces mangrovi Wang et al. 2018]|uniref:hypothetical protein n=1 Tax=Agromyces mangrovi TaxID=1858653 RepID=UPI00257385A4|nr:hypothetical protein [Agromyces mangrovi]BDZ65018.1 hypothetical protein GCM10025877_19560 [Agromyces mangrovi]
MRIPSLLLPAIAAAALLLTGCTGGGADAPEDDVSATVDGSGATATADADEGDADASGDADGSADGDCLVGDWVLSESDLQAYYSVVGAASGMEMKVDGTSGLRLTADTFAYTPDMLLTLAVDGATASATIGGSLSGDYATTDGVITTTSEVHALLADVTVDGTPIGDSSMANELLAASPVSDAPYDCSGANPVVMFDTGVGERVPVTLLPAG